MSETTQSKLASDVKHCQFTWTGVDESETIDAPDRVLPYKPEHCCYRETVDEGDRCVWHTSEGNGERIAVALENSLQEPDVREQTGTEFLDGADVTGCDLSHLSLRRVSLRCADLTGADLSETDLTGADLSGAQLVDADLSGDVVNRVQATFAGADLTNADLSDQNLSDADFENANLTGADLSGADLTDATLTGANLTNADLRESNIEDAEIGLSDMVTSGSWRLQCQAIDQAEVKVDDAPVAASEFLPELSALWTEAPHFRTRLTSLYSEIARNAPLEFVQFESPLEQLVALFEDDPSEADEELLVGLETIAKEAPVVLEDEISSSSIQTCLDNGSQRERQAAYVIAGAVNTPSSLEILTDVGGSEHDSLQETADDALASAGQRLASRLESKTGTPEREIIDCLEVITRQQVETFEGQCQSLCRQLQDSRADVASAIVDRLEEFSNE